MGFDSDYRVTTNASDGSQHPRIRQGKDQAGNPGQYRASYEATTRLRLARSSSRVAVREMVVGRLGAAWREGRRLASIPSGQTAITTDWHAAGQPRVEMLSNQRLGLHLDWFDIMGFQPVRHPLSEPGILEIEPCLFHPWMASQ